MRFSRGRGDYKVNIESCTPLHVIRQLAKSPNFLNFCRYYGFWQPLWIFINHYFVFQKFPIMSSFKSTLSGIQLDSLKEVTCLYISLMYFLKFLDKTPFFRNAPFHG